MNLQQYLRGWFSLRLENGQVTRVPGTWLLGTLDNLSEHVEGSIAEGNVDFRMAPGPQEAPKAMWLQGYVKDIFGWRQLTARMQVVLRTAVGPWSRDPDRVDPLPQDLVGVVWRVSGPVDEPQRLKLHLESYQY